MKRGITNRDHRRRNINSSGNGHRSNPMTTVDISPRSNDLERLLQLLDNPETTK